MMIARRWKPCNRKGVSLAGRICFSDTIWPSGLEATLFTKFLETIPEAQQVPRNDVEQRPGRRSFHALQVNKYDPKLWAGPEPHVDSGNAGTSWMIVLGDFKGGACYIRDRPAPATPTKIEVRNKWILFDGLKEHWADPITEGTRYSAIAFSFADLV